MRSFFHSWRRKVGCITLVMACAMTTVWVRSLSWEDDLSLRVSDCDVLFIETYDVGICGWWVWESQPLLLDDVVYSSDRFTWTSQHAPQWGRSSPRLDELKERRWLGFSTLRETEATVKFQAVMVPYVFPAMLLTILSAWLLLWTPRTRTAVRMPPGIDSLLSPTLEEGTHGRCFNPKMS